MIAAILFYTYPETENGCTVSMSDYAGIEIWLAMIVGILLIIFGALRLTVEDKPA